MAETVVRLPAPELSTILAYKSVWALCTTDRDGRTLKATHYAVALINGRSPIWGVYLVTGRFLRFASSRAQIEAAYPKLVWRRRMAAWRAVDLDNHPADKRRIEIAQRYGKPLPPSE